MTFTAIHAKIRYTLKGVETMTKKFWVEYTMTMYWTNGAVKGCWTYCKGFEHAIDAWKYTHDTLTAPHLSRVEFEDMTIKYKGKVIMTLR